MRSEERKNRRVEINVETHVSKISAPDAEYSSIATAKNLCLGGAYILSASPPVLDYLVQLKIGRGLIFSGKVIRVEELIEDTCGFAVEFISGLKGELDTGFSNGHGEKPYILRCEELNEVAFQYYTRLNRVFRFVQENRSEHVTLSRAAQIAAMERTYFSTVFRTRLGVPFSHWLQFMRVREALNHLHESNISVSELAYSSGFNSLRSFERAFMRWTGLTAADFKKLLRPLDGFSGF